MIQSEVLFAEFAPLVRRLIRQYGDNPELREDLKGEIYCQFCSLVKAYDPGRGVPLRPYLVRQLSASVYTYARQQWRREKREVSLLAATENSREVEFVPDPTGQWDTELVLQQVRASLPVAIRNLPPRQRKVVIWRYYEERSFEEIAQILTIQVTTARSLLRHGLNNLRKAMGSENCGSK